MALLLELLGRTGRQNRWVAVNRIPEVRRMGGFYATSVRGYRLGSCWIPIRPSHGLYFRLPHLGAASWAALAERGFNPFTATKRLP